MPQKILYNLWENRGIAPLDVQVYSSNVFIITWWKFLVLFHLLMGTKRFKSYSSSNTKKPMGLFFTLCWIMKGIKLKTKLWFIGYRALHFVKNMRCDKVI